LKKVIFSWHKKCSFNLSGYPNQERNMKHKSKKKSDALIKSKETSLAESQGVPKYSGSSYNGQGKVDHGKIISNKPRR
jgi:hypothetical protein